ncbi:glutamate racemase [Oceanospirillum sp. D5]|uniref:Glutamate racemase n=1 Tax=Oceanospirillum sediminis TaxID=2760088 RepID=A0A839IJ26_9GAMM|nr:glutamate racemase [Oceanospirillum sediminis]
MSQSFILVLDSGIGGLSVLHEIQLLCPDHPLLYLGDSEALPYGDKSEAWLINRLLALTEQLMTCYLIDMLVVACNTASTVVLGPIRDKLNIPVVGVVPAIKPAAQRSESRHIGLLATPGTVHRQYTDYLVDCFASGCQVTRVGTTDLVVLAEDKLAGRPVCPDRLSQVMEPLFCHSNLDTIVLGCTHFPFLKPELEQIAPRAIQWIDSGKAVARQVKSLLNLPGSVIRFPVSNRIKVNHALFTGALPEELAAYLMQVGFTHISRFNQS